MLNTFISIIKNKIVVNLPFIFLILILGTYLTVKAIPENTWDNWRQGSAQTLLSDRHWVNDGFFKNYLLFLPQGYSKVVRYFDDLPLRQHAHGATAGGLIGQRLYYNHYPSGYLLPTALLMKMGVENRVWFRFLEIIFSLGSLFFLYWFLSRIAGRIGAFFGVLFYAISIPFFAYADSLANQPIDALLSFAIVALSVWIAESTPPFSAKKKKYWSGLIWILYFILAFSSYDSTFFIFAWLVGLDLIKAKKLEWRKLMLWASAPILAFGLQIFQSVLYLGWHDMLLDFYGIFHERVISSELIREQQNPFASHIKKLIDPFDWFFAVKQIVKNGLGIFIAIFGFVYVWIITRKKDSRIYKYLALAGAATLFNFLLFPSLFFYQGKIVAVFGGLLIAAIISETPNVWRLKKKLIIPHLLILIFILGLFILQIKRSNTYLKTTNDNKYSAEAINYDKKIKNLLPGDKVVFQMLSLFWERPETSTFPIIRPPEKFQFSLYDSHINILAIDPYPQVSAEDEYYVGSPILGFTRTDDVIRDLSYLKRRSEFPFSVIILSDQKEILRELFNKIETKKISQNNLKIVELEDDKFALCIF